MRGELTEVLAYTTLFADSNTAEGFVRSQHAGSLGPAAVAAAYCHRLYVLSHGQVVAEGRPEEALTPEIIQQVFSVRAVPGRQPLTGSLQFAVVPLSMDVEISRSRLYLTNDVELSSSSFAASPSDKTGCSARGPPCNIGLSRARCMLHAPHHSFTFTGNISGGK